VFSQQHPIGLFNLTGFPVGTVIDIQKFNSNDVYRDVVLREFNSITSENVFKPAHIHPSPENYNLELGDALAGFCEFHKLRLHGHTLIWGEELPLWIREYQGSRENWIELMRSHIHTVVAHYRGKVQAWDVINEAFKDDGTFTDNVWHRNIGDDYFEKAFMFAREADPDVKLFYNDFSLEYNEYKRRSVIASICELKQRGIIDGVGVQLHADIYCGKDLRLADTFRELSDAGLLIHLSEVDISVNPFDQELDSVSAFLEMQADLFVHIFTEYGKIPAAFRHGITLWGVGDGDSWIRHLVRKKEYPLLFDDEYRPKPALLKLRDLAGRG
jgi:endo-1,4-beta-xylanase